MRKVRDYDAELKALGDKARTIKARRIQRLGELVVATGADTLDPEILAGLLLSGILPDKSEAREAWRTTGAAFFQRRGRKDRGTAAGHGSGSAAGTTGETAG